MNYPLRSARILVLLLTTCLIAACGFHLRGSLNNNSDIRELAVSGQDPDGIRYFSRAFERSAQQQGVDVGGLYEQRIAISVVYQLQTDFDLPLFSEQTLTRERFVTQSENAANAAESEQSVIFSELREELIAAMLRQLFSLSEATLANEAEKAAARHRANEPMADDAALQTQPEL